MTCHVAEEEKRIEPKRHFAFFVVSCHSMFVPFKIKVATGNDKSTTLFSKTKQYCLLVSLKQIFCPNEKTFTKLGTILQERRSFSNSFQSVWRDDIFPTNIKLDLTQENATKMVHWGKVLFFYLIESGRLVQLQH